MKSFRNVALATLAVAGLACGGAAQAAGSITFDGLNYSPFAPTMPLLGDGDEFYQSGYWMDPFSNQAGSQPGDLVGAIVDGSDVANTCFSVACPTNNPTKFFTALNDGVLAMGRVDGEAFNLYGFDASFVGAGGDVFPGITLLLRAQGVKVGGGTLTAQVLLPGPTNGAFSFSTYATSAAFSSQLFTQVFFFGLACNAAGSCSAFSSDKGQFALDNISLTAAVPEPAEWMLLGLGLAFVGGLVRHRKAV